MKYGRRPRTFDCIRRGRRGVPSIFGAEQIKLQGLGHAILGNFSIDQVVIKLTEITK